ncbi:hypothetical protein K9N68_37160 (plasmid) [Kovacikia minuta CCNUW1]|uniref:hypothetical protein n=1 Tax=Kovacikia minuta TaxID=2931930 RepID=UPI001CCC351D|nr:hypothetical protein [Kovacikia minuta]UBF29842.1 hypothetical protein K9N68_37160 [Kovacikia minuta CCNUW1]
MNLEEAKQYWMHKKVALIGAKYFGLITEVEDYGNDNQRLTIEFKSTIECSIKVPGWTLQALKEAGYKVID